MSNYFFIFFLISVFILCSSPAYAYIGPAIAFLGYLLGPVAAVVVVIGMVLFLPLKALLKKIKANKETKADLTPKQD